MISCKIIQVVHSLFIYFVDVHLSLSTYLIFDLDVNSIESFFLEIFSFVERYLTDNTMLITLNARDNHLFLVVTNEFCDYEIISSILRIRTVDEHSRKRKIFYCCYHVSVNLRDMLSCSYALILSTWLNVISWSWYFHNSRSSQLC